MAQLKLKVKEVESARIDSGEKLLSDGDCLFLRVRPESKTWVFIYRTATSRPKLSMGIYPTVSLAEARSKAETLRKQLADGTDPQEERKRVQAAKIAEKAIKDALPQTVKDLFDLWQKRELKKRKDGGRKDDGTETRRKFEKDVFTYIGNLPLDAVRRAHIMQILDNVKARPAPRIAGILLSDMRQMFAFAVDREIMAGDPTAGMKKSKLGGNANERERVLNEVEIKRLWKSVPKALGEVQQRAIWIMLSTACRIGEITQAAWADVDLDAGTWTIPPENSKNTKPHTISLSRFALDQFKAMHTEAERFAKDNEREISEWVMPARHNKGCVCSKSLTKQVANRQREAGGKVSNSKRLSDDLLLPGGKWTPHDLRRTGATIMGMLGVRPDVIEKCLNHTEQNKIQRIYQRAELRPEMAEAWRLLGERLELLTSNADNVVTLKSNKGKAA
jgi:integrase